MLKTLAQIVATFLAIGTTFVAAYLVYLYSASSNIEEKISREGLEIFTILRSATYVRIFGSSISETALIKNYQAKYQDKTRVYIYERIAHDLIGAGVFNDDDAKQMLSAGELGKHKDYILGRTFFWLIERSLDYLVSEKVYWSGRGGMTSMIRPPDSAQATSLFPVGTIAAEAWTQDSKIITNYLAFLFLHKDIFIFDVEQFIDKLSDDFKGVYKEYDYKKWLSEIENVTSMLDIHSSRVNSLLFLKKNYAVDKRLPHRGWILLLGCLAFMSGIIIPLALLAFNCDNAPPAVNAAIGISAFAFLLGGTSLIMERCNILSE